MYPLLHANLGRQIAGTASSSGLGRLLAAFAAILALALFVDATTLDTGPASASQYSQASIQERN